MTPERLYEFWVLSKTLNYNKAAEQLFLNQSLLSKHIAAMEKELNTQLFLRTSHEVTLTEAGKMLARQAEEIISRCDQAERLMRQPLETKAATHSRQSCRIRTGPSLTLQRWAFSQ